MARHFLYVADPMCSWCWGFSPVIGEIDKAFGAEVPVRVMVGGLRPYTETPMTPRDKEFVREHWEHVRDASGQPFDFGFFDRDGFVYDTEPACRAVVAARKIDDAKTLALLARIHRAFYNEQQDTADENVLADLAAEVGFERDAFLSILTSDEAKEETRGDFWFSQQSGVTGFPTLLAVEDGQALMVTQGYQPWESLKAGLTQWVDGTLQTGPAS